MKRLCALVLVGLLLVSPVLPSGVAQAKGREPSLDDLLKHVRWFDFDWEDIWKALTKGKSRLADYRVIEGGHTLVPVNSIVNKLGGKVDFDKKTKQATLTFGKTVIIMKVGDETCLVNGKKVKMPLAPTQAGNNGTMFVPAGFLAERLGAEVRYLPNGKLVIISGPGSVIPEEPDKDEPKQGLLRTTPLGNAEVKDELKEWTLNKPTLFFGPAGNLLSRGVRDDKQLVLVLSRGWQRSSGYGIEAKSIYVDDGRLVIEAQLTDPARSSSNLTVIQYVCQVLRLDEAMPEIDGWRIEDTKGNVLNEADLPERISFQSVTNVDVAWADLTKPGVEVKPVDVRGLERLLLVIKRGQMPSSGYGLRVNNIELNRFGQITVNVRSINPDSADFTADVITYPYQAVYIDPMYFGHEFQVQGLSNELTEVGFTPVDGLLLSRIDTTKRQVVAGYGRDILRNPGKLADVFLVAALRGTCPTGGYDIEVKRLLREGNTVYVVVDETDPKPGSMVTTALTYPYRIVRTSTNLRNCKFVLVSEREPAEIIDFEAVRGTLKTRIDRTKQQVLKGYGRELLQDAGKLADDYLIALLRGTCPTGGYGVEVTWVTRTGDTLQIYARKIDPDPKARVTQALTYPYAIIKVDPALAKQDLKLELNLR